MATGAGLKGGLNPKLLVLYCVGGVETGGQEGAGEEADGGVATGER